MAELRREFSYVLVYSPQVSQHMGGLLLGQVADGVILILESMVTRRETARTAKEDLAAANVKILGAVLNNHTFPSRKSLQEALASPSKRVDDEAQLDAEGTFHQQLSLFWSNRTFADARWKLIFCALRSMPGRARLQ